MRYFTADGTISDETLFDTYPRETVNVYDEVFPEVLESEKTGTHDVNMAGWSLADTV